MMAASPEASKLSQVGSCAGAVTWGDAFMAGHARLFAVCRRERVL